MTQYLTAPGIIVHNKRNEFNVEQSSGVDRNLCFEGNAVNKNVTAAQHVYREVMAVNLPT